MNMKPHEYVAAITGNKERATAEITEALSRLEGQHGNGTCPAFPHVTTAIRANGFGVMSVMDNQVLQAKYLTNGGLPSGGKWTLALGPIKISGRGIFDFVVISILVLIVGMHFKRAAKMDSIIPVIEQVVEVTQ